MVAFANCDVDEAKIPERAQSAVEVADVVVPKTVGWVKASYPVRPVPVMVTGEEPRTVNAEHEAVPVHDAEVVATEPKVERPEVLVKYARPEMTMSVVVAIWVRSFVAIVTFPVAPETVMPVPATFERTPALLNDVPSYVMPVPAVVVALLYTTPFASTASAPVESPVKVRDPKTARVDDA